MNEYFYTADDCKDFRPEAGDYTVRIIDITGSVLRFDLTIRDTDETSLDSQPVFIAPGETEYAEIEEDALSIPGVLTETPELIAFIFAAMILIAGMTIVRHR